MTGIKRRMRIRNEGGAVAVVFAIVAVLMLSMAAIGVDLGNAMNRKKQTQTSADFAALAGANELPAADTVNVAANTAILQAVADYINDNQPRTDGTDKCNTDSTPGVTPAELSDGHLPNGEVEFPSSTRVKVYSPSSKVQFGLANAMGFSDTCVQSVATARIASAAVGMAPYYTTTSCASGPQILKSDAPGNSIPFTVPTLFADGESNGSVLSGDLIPSQIATAPAGDPPNASITVSGSNMDATRIDQVGFFNSDRTAPVLGTITSQNASGITVTVPNEVQSRQDVWWIRVHQKAATPPATPGPNSDKWSARDQARPLQVGDAVLSCNVDPSSGNFGAIDIPWTNNPNNNLEKGIKDGLPDPMTLAAFPGPAPYPDQDECKTDSRGVISTSTIRRPGTNCVDSTPGLRAGPAYDGYLKNSDGKLRVDTHELCQNLGFPQRVTLSTGESINADRLSCFLKNDSLRLSDAINYTGHGSAFVPEIWESPRMALVPVIAYDPNGTKYMPIIRFVPAFITDEVTGSSRQHSYDTGQTETGLVTKTGNQLRAFRVIFFDIDALPAAPDGTKLIDYIGGGKKVITLVN